MDPPKKSARWFRPRISLRGLLVAVALLGVLFAYLAMQWRSAKHQEASVAGLKPVGGGASFDYRLKNYGPDSSSPKQATWVPEWLRERLGRDFFETIQSVGFGNPNNRDGPPRTTDEALEILQEFPGVREVTLFATDVTDRGVEQLVNCPDLHFVTLWMNKHITPEAMKSIKQLRRLHTFESYGTLNSDAGLAHLKELTELRELFLIDFRPQSGITDDGLKHVGEMKSLNLLSIHTASVTDQGLIHLENLSELRELSLSKTKATPDGVQRLQRALPNCEIEINP